MFLEKLIEGTKNRTISNEALSQFYREIGECFFKFKNYDNSLYWFKNGIELNSKLGVKKKTIEIKSLIKPQ